MGNQHACVTHKHVQKECTLNNLRMDVSFLHRGTCLYYTQHLLLNTLTHKGKLVRSEDVQEIFLDYGLAEADAKHKAEMLFGQAEVVRVQTNVPLRIMEFGDNTMTTLQEKYPDIFRQLDGVLTDTGKVMSGGDTSEAFRQFAIRLKIHTNTSIDGFRIPDSGRLVLFRSDAFKHFQYTIVRKDGE